MEAKSKTFTDLRGQPVYPDGGIVQSIQLNLFSDDECTLLGKHGELSVIGNINEIFKTITGRK